MKAIGIDLGTTNSAAAIGGSDPQILPNRENEQLTPSVVSLLKRRQTQDSEIVVGRMAVNNSARDPTNTVFSVKRLMGLLYGDSRMGEGYASHSVDDVRSRVSFKIANAPTDGAADQGVRIQLGEKTYTPVEISAMILRKIRDGAELALGCPVTHAVITVPAYFEERQRQATMSAGELAGLKILQIIDEPSAAAIAFGAGRESEKHRVLVYDLGGGTFDISIIQMSGGTYQVLEIQGDNWLGGDDFDRTIVRRIVEWVKEHHDTDPSSDLTFMAKAKEEAERAKKALSAQQSAEILFNTKIEGLTMVDIDMVLTREEFESDITPLVDRTISLLRDALQNQSFETDSITEVLLVGGSTSVPLVQGKVVSLFGAEKVRRHLNPMECVALGAGILSGKFELKEDGTSDGTAIENTVFQVTPMHLGIAAVKGNNADAFVAIIPKGTPYPLSSPRRQICYATEAGQKVLRIPIFEGLNETASLNEQQGVIEVPLTKGVDAATPIEVSFNYDRNRVLTVSVLIPGHPSFSETVRRDRARAPKKEKANLGDDWRDGLQPTLRTTQHFLDSYTDYMDGDDLAEVGQLMKDGEAALKSGNESAGRQILVALQNKLLTCGIASQIFMAERVMSGAAPEDAKDLVDASALLRQAWKSKRFDDASNLALKLRTRVAQVMMSRRVTSVEDKLDLRDYLRVKE